MLSLIELSLDGLNVHVLQVYTLRKKDCIYALKNFNLEVNLAEFVIKLDFSSLEPLLLREYENDFVISINFTIYFTISELFESHLKMTPHSCQLSHLHKCEAISPNTRIILYYQ